MGMGDVWQDGDTVELIKYFSCIIMMIVFKWSRM